MIYCYLQMIEISFIEMSFILNSVFLIELTFFHIFHTHVRMYFEKNLNLILSRKRTQRGATIYACT